MSPGIAGNKLSLLQAIGLPLHTTHQTRLPELLRFPEVTRDLGNSKLDDSDVLILQIGPGLPTTAIEGHDLWLDGWMRLTLAIKKHYIPLRTEIYMKVPSRRSADFYRTKGIEVVSAPDSAAKDSEYYKLLVNVLELRDVPDAARNGSVPFPWRVETISGVTVSIVCKEVAINPDAPPSAFTSPAPADYALVVDGQFTRVRPVSRGNSDHTLEAVAVQDIGAKAREILDRPVTERASEPVKWDEVVWIVLGGLSVGVLLYLVFKRSFVHD